jgi:hypothetical protein
VAVETVAAVVTAAETVAVAAADGNQIKNCLLLYKKALVKGLFLLGYILLL